VAEFRWRLTCTKSEHSWASFSSLCLPHVFNVECSKQCRPSVRSSSSMATSIDVELYYQVLAAKGVDRVATNVIYALARVDSA
jgi:hypothetical protein